MTRCRERGDNPAFRTAFHTQEISKTLNLLGPFRDDFGSSAFLIQRIMPAFRAAPLREPPGSAAFLPPAWGECPPAGAIDTDFGREFGVDLCQPAGGDPKALPVDLRPKLVLSERSQAPEADYSDQTSQRRARGLGAAITALEIQVRGPHFIRSRSSRGYASGADSLLRTRERRADAHDSKRAQSVS